MKIIAAVVFMALVLPAGASGSYCPCPDTPNEYADTCSCSITDDQAIPSFNDCPCPIIGDYAPVIEVGSTATPYVYDCPVIDLIENAKRLLLLLERPAPANETYDSRAAQWRAMADRIDQTEKAMIALQKSIDRCEWVK